MQVQSTMQGLLTPSSRALSQFKMKTVRVRRVEKEAPCTVLVGLKLGAVSTGQHRALSWVKKRLSHYSYIQLFVQKNLNQDPKAVSALPC